MKVSLLMKLFANYPSDAEVVIRKVTPQNDQVPCDGEPDLEIESVQLSDDSKKVILYV